MKRALFVVATAAFVPLAQAAAARPNIVHIIADDLGWGDVGFNGQTKIRTRQPCPTRRPCRHWPSPL